MTFTLDHDVAAVLAAAGDLPPMPAVGDVAGRRAALNPMLEYFNNHVQPIASDVTITDHQVETADGAQCWPAGTSCPQAKTQPPSCTCTAAA